MGFEHVSFAVLSDRFMFQRQQEDQFLRGLEYERGADIFQKTIAPFVDPYELPMGKELAPERNIAEQQMKWGACQLIKKTFNESARKDSKSIPYKKMLSRVDYLQALCAITDIADWRVGDARVSLSVMDKISLSEAGEIRDLYNDILNRSYGYGVTPVLAIANGILGPVDPQGFVLHDILRIEKFDRLRKGVSLR